MAIFPIGYMLYSIYEVNVYLEWKCTSHTHTNTSAVCVCQPHEALYIKYGGYRLHSSGSSINSKILQHWRISPWQPVLTEHSDHHHHHSMCTHTHVYLYEYTARLCSCPSVFANVCDARMDLLIFARLPSYMKEYSTAQCQQRCSTAAWNKHGTRSDLYLLLWRRLFAGRYGKWYVYTVHVYLYHVYCVYYSERLRHRYTTRTYTHSRAVR